MLVQHKTSASRSPALAERGLRMAAGTDLKHVEHLEAFDIHVRKVQNFAHTTRAVRGITKLREVEYVQPNYIYHTAALELFSPPPEDQRFGEL